jgi:hypothetical protein
MCSELTRTEGGVGVGVGWGWGGDGEEPVKITGYRNSGRVPRDYVAYAFVFLVSFITCRLYKLTLQTVHSAPDCLSDLV